MPVGTVVITELQAAFIALGVLVVVLLLVDVAVRAAQGPLQQAAHLGPTTAAPVVPAGSGSGEDTEPPVAGARRPVATPSPVARRRRGIKTLVVGGDGRASTSKLQVVLWTFAVVYVFAFLLVWGRSSGCEGENPKSQVCREAATGRAAFENATDQALQPEYYVLLGFPLAAAVAAKALTSNKVIDGSVTKPPLEPDTKGLSEGLAEIVSNDKGEIDLLDFQYFAFNLLTLAFFAIEFLAHPARGLPDLPPTLIALSGIAAATYTTKKGLETARPAITAVAPGRLPAVQDRSLTIVGTGFGAPPSAPRPGDPIDPGLRGVFLDGEVLHWDAAGWRDDRIVAQLTDAAARLPGASHQLMVMDGDGATSPPFALELYEPE